MDIKVIFEDKNTIVINKPCGISSQTNPDMDNNVLSELNKNGYKGELYTVHRLDKGVGGIMIYAKNKHYAAKLSECITNGKFEKVYYAIVSGEPEESTGRYEDILFKDSSKQKSYVIKKERKGAKKAALRYEVIKTLKSDENSLSLVRVYLETGRFHQIRCQFASRKMPIAGDGKYGSKDNKAKNIALFSNKISYYLSDKNSISEYSDIPDTDVYPWNLFKSEL